MSINLNNQKCQACSGDTPVFNENQISEMKHCTENQILSSAIETPNDIEDKYNISGGHWSHGDMEIDQLLMMRPFYGSSQYSTPINGLYLCSAGTHPGGGITGINGVNAAKQLLKDKGNG